MLNKLKKDDQDADLWLEAAKLYLASGDLENALMCGEMCRNIDGSRRSAKLLVTKVKKAMASQETGRDVEEKEAGDAEKMEEPREEKAADVGDAEEIMHPGGSVLWLPEEERPRFRNEEEALQQLRQELSASRTVTCPSCNTLLEVEETYCYGCGREMKEQVETLEQRVDLAKSRLEEDEKDRDALFTLGAYLAVSGEPQEALEVLNRLTMMDQQYPGLWWLKARVFEQLGKREASQSAMKRAMQLDAQMGAA